MVYSYNFSLLLNLRNTIDDLIVIMIKLNDKMRIINKGGDLK